MRHQQPFGLPAVLATAAILLPLLYASSYRAMIDPALDDGTSSTIRFHPKYRIGGRAAEVFFYPAQWVEERVFGRSWH
jgi:hypothetical protein